MKNTFSRNFTVFALAWVLGSAFIACGDDDSSSPKGTGLPAEVADKAELETYECSMDVIGEKVYVADLELNYECDGEKWFKSYDQTKPSSTSTKSSGSKDTDGSSDSKAADKDGSSSDATTSSSSAKSSSSRPTEILEPEITVNETCTEVGACDAMVKTDVSTWHFVRKDDFGDDAEYTYTVDGKDLIVTIKNADGTTNSKTYSMYNMESEAGVEMAFNAAKSTCKNGGGNDNKIKSCVKDTVKALPECNASREGFIGKKDSSSYVVCKNGSWEKAKEIDMDTYGKTCTNAEVGTRTNGVVTETNKYYCTANGWVSLMRWNWNVPKEAYFNPNITYGSMTDERDGKVYRTVQIGDQIWMAENLNYADSVKTPSLLERSWCYDNKTENCDVAGRLYTWAAAIDSVALYDNGNGVNCGAGVNCTMPKKVRGICPSGWHLPRFDGGYDDEFLILYNAAGEETSGKALKSQIGWEYCGNEYFGTDTLGFSGIPAGYRISSGSFTSAGHLAYFHTTLTSADFSHYTTHAEYLSYGSKLMGKQRLEKSDAYSVRCIKDSE
ncbi:major paralogous domain-containing protein [Fibrobacter sp. UWT3]|uniref:fibrobacter succinogenes major paralogous domain-containing protein n=1 Tax=Fibrobacter sp. UWT3 TaxID=1896225 RepID=UPI000BC69EE1|nr:fibrobacter succinogenes major paralogous domain-containing protein [Fibrobacter sp. UWT3]SOE50412.1 major paralogous domain-containing protein [Fibrobacter sp. UWT3]